MSQRKALESYGAVEGFSPFLIGLLDLLGNCPYSHRMAPATKKDERFELRLGADEREMLRRLSENIGESEAVTLRQLIRKAFAVLQEQAPKKKR